jgi:MFS family permease
LLGWAVGGTVFGRLGDLLGRSRTMSLTILVYAAFTGLSALAQSWQQVLAFRFLCGMGIGGEWAAGAALVSETWPRHWRPWVSAVLMSAYEIGMLVAATAGVLLAESPRMAFVIGALPALAVWWIRRSIPEPAEWRAARSAAAGAEPGIADLFRGDVRRTTILTTLLCSVALTIAWAFLYFMPQHLRTLPEIHALSDAGRTRYVNHVFFATTLAALAGNFAAALLVRRFRYRGAIALMFLGGMLGMIATYAAPHGHPGIVIWLSLTNFFVLGLYGLFPLYIPPLFPTLLRTTGAGFCYNVGRVVAASGLLIFGLLTPLHDYGRALFFVAFLHVPVILLALRMPEPREDEGRVLIYE